MVAPILLLDYRHKKLHPTGVALSCSRAEPGGALFTVPRLIHKSTGCGDREMAKPKEDTALALGELLTLSSLMVPIFSR